MVDLIIGYVVGSVVTGWMAWLWVSELRNVLMAFVEQETEYMKLNKLGDPENQHNVKWALRVLGNTPKESSE